MTTVGQRSPQEEQPACWKWPLSREKQLWLKWFKSPETDPASIHPKHERALWFLNDWQQGRCAICGLKRELVIDHNHDTQLIRGYLCKGCNSTEGRLNVKRPLYREYRKKNPTSILGLAIPYKSSWNLKSPANDVEIGLSARLQAVKDRIHATQAAGQSIPVHLVDELLEIATAGVRALKSLKQRGL